MPEINTKRIFRDVLRHNKLASCGLVSVIVCVVAAGLLPPQILKVLMDGPLTQGQRENLPALAALYFASFLLIGLFDFLKGLALTVFGQKLVREIRWAMAEKLSRIRAGYFSANPGGTITSHFLSDVENISSLFSEGLVSLAIDCCKIGGIVLSIWLFSTQLGLFTLCLLPILYGLTTFFRRRMLSAQVRNLEEIGRVNNHIAETIKNVLMIQSFHKARYMEAGYEADLRANYATMSRVNLYDSCYSPLIQLLTALATAAVLLLASDGRAGVSIGTVAASITLLTNLFAPVDNLGTELQSIQKGLSGIRSVDAFLAQEEDRREELPLDLERLRREGATLCFDAVSFAYSPESPVLEDLSLHLPPRESVCFVGRTGVGKTTLFKLITGLLRPTAGRITLGGVDVYRIPAGQKRQIFGYVEQHFSFVRGDIALQISLGNPAISQAQIEAALRFVGLHDMVQALEKGYRTEADGGALFSQGQKQLLSIARAIVMDPPILLLDEVTANLDSVTEARVVEVLKKAGREKTILSISHRASSMRGSDHVVRLENGRIQA
ncbi:MAG: ABC transporter ATP-binding protein [Oscillibacter sp.]